MKYLILMITLLSSSQTKVGNMDVKLDQVDNKVISVTEQEKRSYLVSHYGHGDGFHGKLMANGKKMNKYNHTAASPLIKGTKKPKYKLGTRLLLVNPHNGKSVEVTITDTGGFRKMGRELDLSYASYKALGDPKGGTMLVEIEILDNKL